VLIQRLQVAGLRRFAQAEFAPAPGFNLLVGDNGSGKTSVLEAVHLLAHGRSFRGRVRDGLVRNGEPALQVLVDWEAAPGSRHRAGLRHTGSSWEARVDGSAVDQLGALCEVLAVVTFEPGSHDLVTGSSEHRRRYLDWGLFHVERSSEGGGFLGHWRRYARALKQRNVLLRRAAGDAQLDAWEQELAASGEALGASRQAYVDALQPYLDRMVAALLPQGGVAELLLQPGWRRQEMELADALLLGRDRDRQLGHTSVGPHRADFRLRLAELPGREGLSRGQAKLAALSLLLAQAAHLAAHDGRWPVLQLDDMASELDRRHQARVLEVLAASGAQVLVTGTEPPPALAALALPVAMFHVEHGGIHPAAG
jgi:DNA replication and repair protein RecF